MQTYIILYYNAHWLYIQSTQSPEADLLPSWCLHALVLLGQEMMEWMSSTCFDPWKARSVDAFLWCKALLRHKGNIFTISFSSKPCRMPEPVAWLSLQPLMICCRSVTSQLLQRPWIGNNWSWHWRKHMSSLQMFMSSGIKGLSMHLNIPCAHRLAIKETAVSRQRKRMPSASKGSWWLSHWLRKLMGIRSCGVQISWTSSGMNFNICRWSLNLPLGPWMGLAIWIPSLPTPSRSPEQFWQRRQAHSTSAWLAFHWRFGWMRLCRTSWQNTILKPDWSLDLRNRYFVCD